jgi:formylglycine-generating enzyme required for sulfatase activity
VADDNVRSINGLFTEEFVKVVKEPGLPIDEVFNRVRESVDRRSGGRQLPWTSSSLVGTFSFRPGASVPPTPARTTDAEVEYWASIRGSQSAALFEAYLRRYPQGQFAELAEARLAELRAGPAAGDVRSNSRDGQRYAWIPPGSFQMGCSPGDTDCSEDEKPAHLVTLSKGFWLGQTEVTVGAYQKYTQATARAMPNEPIYLFPLNKGWANQQQPIVNVTWDEAKAYCAWAGLRLPTEAEWEYAARAGSKGARYGSLDLDDIAWFVGNSGSSRLDTASVRRDRNAFNERLKANGNGPRAAGQKKPNGYNLYDMLGNAPEWTQDWWEQYEERESRDPQGPPYGEAHVVRGGSWVDFPRTIRVSVRVPDRRSGGARVMNIGFRCAGEALQ